jgi:hypothetical protein
MSKSWLEEEAPQLMLAAEAGLAAMFAVTVKVAHATITVQMIRRIDVDLSGTAAWERLGKRLTNPPIGRLNDATPPPG